MLIAQLNQPVQEEMVVVSYTTKVDALIRVSTEQHTNQSFFFNPLVQTKHLKYRKIKSNKMNIFDRVTVTYLVL